MALAPGSCPSGYNWYTCANPVYKGCCAVDACSPLGCPPGSEYSPVSSSQSSPRGSAGGSVGGSGDSGLARSTSETVKILTVTPTAPPINAPPPTPWSTKVAPSLTTWYPPYKTTSAQQDATTSGSSPGASSGPTLDNGSNKKHISLGVVIGAAIGGALIMLIIILTVILYRRHRKRKNSAEGLPTHGGDPEPLPDDGAVKAERTGLLALFRRTRPTSAAQTTTPQTGPPSTACTELPSPSYPQSSQHNSLIPGFAELPSPPFSSVSELSSGDRAVYSSTDVSTASTGAVVSPMPYETLRGGGRPVMTPNMVSRGRDRRKHALSWQSLEPGDGS